MQKKMLASVLGTIGVTTTGVGLAHADQFKVLSQQLTEQAASSSTSQAETTLRLSHTDLKIPSQKLTQIKTPAQKQEVTKQQGKKATKSVDNTSHAKPTEVAATDVPEVTVEPAVASTSAVPSVGQEVTHYTVQPGDSLSTIAQQHGVAVTDLIQANGGHDLITVGQIIDLQAPVALPEEVVASEAQDDVQVGAVDEAVSEPMVPESTPVDEPAQTKPATTENKTVTTSPVVTDESATQTVVTSNADNTVEQTASEPVAASEAPTTVNSTQLESTTHNDTETVPTPAAEVAQPQQDDEPAPQAQPTSTPTRQNSSVVGLALQLATQNIPYVWGGASVADGFDCSGLVSYVYAQKGINLPHSTTAQEGYVQKTSIDQAQPGDLLFWGQDGATYHVAIYIGNDQYVAAPEPGKNVQVETISEYFMPSFAGIVQ